ncbi:MAG: hypothetical protein ACE5HD_01735 [Acidobacteriota bacterium]
MPGSSLHGRRRQIGAALGVAGLLVFSGIFLPAPALAGSNHRVHGHFDRHGHHGAARHRGHHVSASHPAESVHGHARVGNHHERFEAPRHIVRGEVEFYNPYYRGRVYYGPHHHYHPVYAFPVYTTYGAVYYANYYCDGRYYGRGSVAYHSPRFSISVGF